MNNLKLSRHGIYYFRSSIPRDLIAVNSPKEIYVSLKTSDEKTALGLSKSIKSYLSTYFIYLRNCNLRYKRGRSNKTGDVMFDLIASLTIGQSEITIKSRDQDSFNNIVQTVLKLDKKNNPKNRELIVDLYKEYCEGTNEELSPTSRTNRRAMLPYVSAIFKGKFIDEVDRDLMFWVKNNLPKLPLASKAKEFYQNNCSIEDVKADMVLITATSTKCAFSRIGAFFNWAVDLGKLEINPFSNQKIVKGKSKTKVVPYTFDELTLLFKPENFVRFHKKDSSRYWISVLALYTGARVGELMQLELTDVITNKNGQMFIHINRNSSVKGKEKRLKNDHSLRLVPLPPRVLDLGFETFLKTIKSEGYPVLFPEFVINEKGETTFGTFSTQFSDYRQNVLHTTDSKKTFHSLRHNVVALLKHKKFPLSDIQQFVGHAYGNITFDVYGEPSEMDEMISLANAIDYDLKIQPWQDSDAQKAKRKKYWDRTVLNLARK